MNEGCNLLTKSKLDKEKLLKDLGFESKDVLFVDHVNDWLKKENELIVIEFRGILEKEDDDYEKYEGYYYYEVYSEKKEYVEKFKNLKDKDITIE